MLPFGRVQVEVVLEGFQPDGRTEAAFIVAYMVAVRESDDNDS